MSHIAIQIPFVTVAQAEWLPGLFEDQPINGWLEQENELIAYVELADWTFETQNVWRERLAEFNLAYSTEALPDTNWNEVWESAYEPVQIGQFCAIRAHFHPPISGVTHDLIITPTRAFGTGHHETTHMMISQMEQLNFREKLVLDFGCGTGVLAILAAKMGAKNIEGIDNETPAVEIAKQNGVDNQTPQVQFDYGSLERATLPHYDFILANIHRTILAQYMAEMKKMISPNGKILLSGILVSDTEFMLHILEINNLRIETKLTKGYWQMWQVVLS